MCLSLHSLPLNQRMKTGNSLPVISKFHEHEHRATPLLMMLRLHVLAAAGFGSDAAECLQFYLGTTRLQLEHKGDIYHHYTSFAQIVPAFGFLGIPFMTWLLDKKGYGATMTIINFLTVLASLFQAMPSLRFQVMILR